MIYAATVRLPAALPPCRPTPRINTYTAIFPSIQRMLGAPFCFSELPLFFERDGLNQIRAADPEYYQWLVARFPEITSLC